LTITAAFKKLIKLHGVRGKRADNNETFVSLNLTLINIKKKEGDTSHIYIDINKDFTEKLIHAQFILKKINFFLDNNWQGD